MNTNTILLFGAIFIILIIGYSESASADNLKEEADNIFRALDEGNIAVSVEDSKYRLHLQTVYRNGDGHLLYVNESTSSAFLPHEITDSVFDTMLGEKEIVTINNTKYEKVAFSNSVQAMYFFDEESAMVGGLWIVQTCDPSFHEYGSECINFLQMRTNQLLLEDNDVIEIRWTVLRAMN